MVNPVFYDFKRGILRLSVLLTLLLFISIGVGLAYLVTSLLATTPLPQYFIYSSTIDSSTGVFNLEVLLMSPEMWSVDGEISYKLGCSKLLGEDPKTGSAFWDFVIVDEGVAKSSNGRIYLEKSIFKQETQFDKNGRPIDKTILETYTCSLYLNVTTPLGTQTTMVHPTGGFPYTPLVFENKTIQVLVGSNPVSNRNNVYFSTSETLVLHPSNTDVIGVASTSIYYNRQAGRAYLLLSLYTPIDMEFEVYIEKPGLQNTQIILGKQGILELNLSEIEEYFNKIDVKVKRGISIVELDTSLFNNTLGRMPSYTVLVLSRSNRIAYSFIPTPSNSILRGQTARIIYGQLLGSTGIGLFASFFPVVVLYLVYVYIAKPRSQGALEFVLARPITRFELFTTRYVAGVLVVFTASLLFYIGLMVSIYFLTGVSTSIQGAILLFTGLTLSLVAFYSLCYLLASLTSGTRYIVVSVFTYILFTMLWSLISLGVTLVVTGGFTTRFYDELVRIQYISYYFNPLRIMDFMQYYFMTVEFEEFILQPRVEEILREVVNPWFVALSTIAWITIPVVLGWLKFKKASLST